MTAITLLLTCGPVLLVNVYMPTDYGTYDCYEEYLDLCTKITALFSESVAAYLFVTGDLICECNATYRFYDILKLFIPDNLLLCSGVSRLVTEFTYCRDDGSCTPWVDHVLCSKILDDTRSITEIDIHYDFQTPDNKPLSVKLTDVCVQVDSTGIR